jgi:competence protein ComEC
MKILQFPLLKVFAGFLFGILLFQIIRFDFVIIFCGLGFCYLALLVIHFHFLKKNSLKILYGGLVIITAFTTGLCTAALHKETLHQNHYLYLISDNEKSNTITLLVHEKLKSTLKNNRYVCLVEKVDNKESFGKIILNISSKHSAKSLTIGKEIIVDGVVYKNKRPFNPSLFDYSSYLENQEIYAQLYTKSTLIIIGNDKQGLWSSFSNFREKIMENLKRSAISNTELNVLNALVLGQQQDIDAEVLKDYQYAGAVHVLSVSGLHVGFLLLFLSTLLKPIGNSRKGSLLKLAIIILSLWSFAILAGLSASIVRSATMFSFVAIGLHLRRTVNIYHTLIVSMLLILLFKPSFLFDVGFQLSYLALFYIVWFQPVLAQIWQPNNKIIKYFWDIITVSFAAQIGAMPLSIYYFHQFPGLFFVTNLLILPLLGIIMAVGVIAVLTASFTVVSFWIIKPLEYLIGFLNGIIHWVATFDYFVFRNIPFSKAMLWCSYLMILFVIFWIKKPIFKQLSMALLSIMLLQTIFIFQKYQTFTQNEMIIFNSRKNTIIAERTGEKTSIYCKDSIRKTLDDNQMIQSYLVGNFCTITAKKSLPNLLYFKQQKILIIDSNCVYTAKINPDIILLIQSPRVNMQRLLNTYHPKQIIADASNYKSYVKLWKATCRKEKIPFHYTNEKGFYKL